MTIIIATLDAMYSDSRCSVGTTHFPTHKIYRYKDQLIGTAGDDIAIEQWVRWYCGPRKKPMEPLANKDDEFAILLLTREGLWTYYSCSVRERVLRPFHCVGAGSKLALGAMAAGATPQRAIEIACEYDSTCGLPVQHFLLNEKAKR